MTLASVSPHLKLPPSGKPRNLRLLIPPNYTNPTQLVYPSQKSINTQLPNTITNPDLQAVAELLATFKQTTNAIQSSITCLEQQTEKLTYFAPAIKAAEQVAEARRRLRDQVNRHENMIQNLQILLKTMVQDRLFEHIKSVLLEQIQESISEQVRVRVQQALPAHTRGLEKELYLLQDGDGSSSIDPRITKPLLCLMPSAVQSPVCSGPLSSSSTIVSAIPRSAFPASGSGMTSLTILLPRGYGQGIRSISVTPSSPNQSTVHYSMKPKTPSGLRRSISQGTQPKSLEGKKGKQDRETRRVNFLLQRVDSIGSPRLSDGSSSSTNAAKTPLLQVPGNLHGNSSTPQSALVPSPSPLPTLIRGFCDPAM